MSFLIMLMLTTNFLFLLVYHPLSMGLMLMIQTLIIAIFSGMLMNSFWYSYILILVFLGGMLILFIYISSLASNEQLNSPPALLITPFFIISSLISLFYFNSPKMLIFSDNSMSINSFSWMFSPPFFILCSFLIIYLFLVLIAVIKITKFWGGTLRPIY